MFLLAQAAFAAPQAALPQERRVALVIGNSAYKAAPLKNPANDARDMAAALKKLGFDVTLLTDAGQQQMDAAVREFGLKLRQGGAGLFYYAGHGLQVGGENYLVPVSANIQTESDVRFTCLPAGMVLGKMEDARNDLNIIILDACRNNPFARSFRNAEQGLAKMDAPTGSLISYATAPGSVASDGAGKNGLFTQHLLRNMATPGLPITEVFMRVRQNVVAETKRQQVPWEASSLIGQFYFSGAAGDQPPMSAPAMVIAAPIPTAPAPAVPAKALDIKAEKRRMAEESARLKREHQELAQLQALQAEKDRLEDQRQAHAQAKLLAMAPRPKQVPPVQQAAPVAAPVAALKVNAHAAQFAALARAGLPDVRAYFEQAVQARPDDAEARAGLVIALVLSGREADTRYQLQRLNESGVHTAGVRLAKGLLLGLEGNQDAGYQFNRALEDGADKALVLLCQATAAARRGDYKKGQQLLAQYVDLVPEPERAESAAGLAKGLDVESALVGRFLLDQGPKSMTTWDMVLDISRQDSTLVGTGTLTMGKVRAFDFKFAESKLTFLMEGDVFLMPMFYWRLTLDLSRGLDSMPVLSVEASTSAAGGWTPAGPAEFEPPPRALVRSVGAVK
ncbi:MAG: hypothetical protein A2051_09690 [Desulfovibrionales bacterium GWA2_65_9]|nr:MAG: hypothetical protein A2051_09690 [Desulfovibrionales bacterium GWA2_65_9]